MGQLCSLPIKALLITLPGIKYVDHVETGVTAVYDRHSYDAEKQIGLNKWAEKLLQIVEGKENRIIKLPSLSLSQKSGKPSAVKSIN